MMQVLHTIWMIYLKLLSQAFFLFHSIAMLAPVSIFRFLKTPFQTSTPELHYNLFKSTHKDVFRSRHEVMKFEGYRIQQFEFETEDQAYVSFWRVVPYKVSPHQSKNTVPRQPIVIQHGLLDCAMSWFLLEKIQRCLPYVLAEAGYDVWIGNNRGTKFSSKNSHLQNYWEYSLDDLVKYDFPCIINSITAYTNSEQLTYIGHSQGTTQFFTSIAMHPQLHHKIKQFYGFGPLISLHGLEDHIILKFMDKSRLCQLLKFIGFRSLFIIPDWMASLIGMLIHNSWFYFQGFNFVVKGLCGFNTTSEKIKLSRFGTIISHEPGGASINNVLQWIQMFRNGGFLKKFDHGTKKNIIMYGTKQSPDYNFDQLANIPFNCHLFKGTSDRVLCQKNFSFLQSKLPKDKYVVHEIHDFAHLDYVWSQNATEQIYHKVIQLLKQNNSSEDKN